MEIQWSLVLFTLISGAGAWLFAASTVQALAKKGELPGKLESIACAVLLAVGGLASVTHLKHVDRIFEALNHPTSGIFVEAAMIGALIVLIVVYLVLMQREASVGARKVLAVVAAVVGVVFTFACGSSYMMEARTPWMTYALPLAYCLTAGAAGAGCNLVLKLQAKAQPEGVSFAGLFQAVLALLAIVATAAFAIHAAGSFDQAATGAVAWLVVAFVSLAAACGCGAYAWKKPEGARALAYVGLAAALLGALAMRVAMWLVGSPLMDFFLMPLD